MLRTPSLRLRPFDRQDTPALFGFMSDPLAMRFTHVASSLEQCQARLSAFEARRSSHGFAPWVILGADPHAVLGWGGLLIDPHEPHWGLKIGYAFHPCCWGQGYGTELVQFSLAHAFAELAANEVCALVSCP